jgi:hypothetical protein
MRKRRTLLRLLTLAALAAAAALYWTGEAGAQCALCRTALEGAGAAASRAMNLGILVLLVPPVAIFCAIFAAAARRKPEEDDDAR